MSDEPSVWGSRLGEPVSTALDLATMAPSRSVTEVLLVDDDDLVRAAHQRLLERSGIKVTSVQCASEALARLMAQVHQFDAVVTDVVMPDTDGVALLREVRRRLPDLPVILMTGQPHVDSAVAAINGGGFRYLTKPVHEGELISCVQEAAGLRRLAHLKRLALEMLQEAPQLLENRAQLDGVFAQSLEQLWVAFQPIVNCRERALFGYEALVRTSSPAMSSPAVLFDAAERLGRVVELGRLIRASVAEAITAVPRGAVLFVNLHALDLRDDDLYDPASPLAKRADRVVLEVTERSSLEQVGDVAPRMAALRALGYRIAVDDLGAGYAGLSSFNLLEPEVVKLDLSLIRDIDSSPRKQSLVRSMIAVCTGELGVEVVCEGVETEKERDTLLDLGANLLQGYLFGRPARGFDRVVFDSQVWPVAGGVLRSARAKAAAR